MNPSIHTLATALSLCCFPPLLSAQTPEEPVPVAPAHPDASEDQVKGQQLLDQAKDQQAQFEKSAADFERQRVTMEKRLGEQGAKAAAAAAKAQKKYAEQVQNGIRRSPAPSSRSLVIRSSEGDPKDLADLEEDLTIMSHVFNKALKENLGASFDRKAMGIDVFFTPGNSSIRSLYLEGYGALFLFGVNWPLLPPPTGPEAAKDNKADSTWDEAKHELYGPRNEGKFPTNPGEEFTNDKLTKLQNILLETAKNAANIRNLKPDEAITMCVFGAPVRSTPKLKAKKDAEGEETGEPDEPKPKREWVFEGTVPRGTTMTIRVKKSDTDAYASGKLTLEQFRGRAHVVTYPGTPLTGNTGFSFITESFGGAGGGFGGGNFGGGISGNPMGW
jgi:hypothetical protein